MKPVFTILFACLLCILPVTLKSQESSSRTLRYGNRTEIGISMGVGKFKTDVINGNQLHAKNDEIILNLRTINGFWYMNRLFIGVGVGAELWQHGLFWPVFGDITYNFKSGDNTFYGAVDLGSAIGNRYGTSYYNSGKGGFLAVIALGYTLKVVKNLKFSYEVFYQYQVIKSTYTNTVDTVVSRPLDYNVPEHFIGFRIGICY